MPPPTLSGWRASHGHLVLVPGMGGLGDLDMNDQAVIDALNAGIDQGTLSTLVAEGASDGQLEALANGQTDVATLMAQLTGNLPAAGSASGTASTFPTPSGLTDAQQAQVQQAITQTGMDPTEESSWYSVTGQLTTMNQNISALEQLVLKYPAVAAASGASIAQLRQDYSSLASEWTGAYTAVFGAAPAGLNGLGDLGIAPVIVVAYIAVFVAVVAGLYALYQHYQVVNTQAQAAVTAAGAQATQASANQTSATNQATLLAEIQAAQTSGNTALATSLAQQLAAMQQVSLTAAPAAAPNLTTWFETNWQWVALAGIVVVLGPGLIKKL
jgi:hypothetical protein